MAGRSTTATFLAIVSSTSAIGIAYLFYRHADLARRVQHDMRKGSLSKESVPDSASDEGQKPSITSSASSSSTTTIATSTFDNIESIPKSILSGDEQVFIVYDAARKTVPTARLPDHLTRDELLNAYVRRNMVTFATWYPQAWALKALCKKYAAASEAETSGTSGTPPRTTRSELRPKAPHETFASAYIRNLNFQVGDIVCGVHRVLVRTSAKIEFSTEMPGPATTTMISEETQGAQDARAVSASSSSSPSANPVKGGRLVISIKDTNSIFDHDDGDADHKMTTFTTESIMWKDTEETRPIPLEVGPMIWLHELASWSLLEGGVNYVVGLKKK
ncbi:hypothetical protein L228DRAFT_12143 [Xylona heveae TC161]|uniref:Uncharacterized protein n=1 Tax=Xylona heveae (strain CBS 132557 / TC161) TaxID=1328760 RepID=A0A165JMB1_XYLHT|nr:hypothetical protein L228DRAFT_12143 [Xylona heveae TC161]KZF26418.1 hypothetical protein L228DRAFT_12143 [Xylona heveae TC161]